MHGFEPHVYVDVGPFFELKEKMLACHKSQLGRDDLSPLAELMRNQCLARGAQSGADTAEAFRIHRAWKRVGAW